MQVRKQEGYTLSVISRYLYMPSIVATGQKLFLDLGLGTFETKRQDLSENQDIDTWSKSCDSLSVH